MIELLGSLTFIAVFIIASIITMIVAIEKEKEGTATLVVSLVLGLLAWNYGRDVLSFVEGHGIETILFSVGYVMVGIIWSFIRWNEKVKGVFRRFTRFKNEFVRTNGEVTDENRKQFNSEFNIEYKHDSNVNSIISTDSINTIAKQITPIGLKHKSLIISWISYWPLSVIGTLLNNPFRRLFEWIYDSLSGLYDRIADNHKNEAFKDLK